MLAVKSVLLMTRKGNFSSLREKKHNLKMQRRITLPVVESPLLSKAAKEQLSKLSEDSHYNLIPSEPAREFTGLCIEVPGTNFMSSDFHGIQTSSVISTHSVGAG